MTEFEIDIVPSAGTDPATLRQALETYESYEETHLIGAQTVKAYVEATVPALKGLFELIKLQKGKTNIEELEVSLGEKSVKVKGVDLSASEELTKLVEEIVNTLKNENNNE